jgi:hypothetical protein
MIPHYQMLKSDSGFLLSRFAQASNDKMSGGDGDEKSEQLDTSGPVDSRGWLSPHKNLHVEKSPLLAKDARNGHPN